MHYYGIRDPWALKVARFERLYHGCVALENFKAGEEGGKAQRWLNGLLKRAAKRSGATAAKPVPAASPTGAGSRA